MFETGSVGLAETQLFFFIFIFYALSILSSVKAHNCRISLYWLLSTRAAMSGNEPSDMCAQWRFKSACASITKTCLYNFDLLKPHIYIVNLGFTGVYIIFLITAQNIDCGYSLEPPQRGGSNEYHNLQNIGGSNEYPQSMFWAEIWKNIRIFIWKLSVFGGEFLNISI